jgi:hypothetical protein
MTHDLWAKAWLMVRIELCFSIQFCRGSFLVRPCLALVAHGLFDKLIFSLFHLFISLVKSDLPWKKCLMDVRRCEPNCSKECLAAKPFSTTGIWHNLADGSICLAAKNFGHYPNSCMAHSFHTAQAPQICYLTLLLYETVNDFPFHKKNSEWFPFWSR